jgi:hypothetical protein
VPEQELDLIQFAAGQLHNWRTCADDRVAPFVDVGTGSSRPDDVQQHLGRHLVAPDAPGLVDRPQHNPCVMPAVVVHSSPAGITQVGIGTVRTWRRLPTKSAITR